MHQTLFVVQEHARYRLILFDWNNIQHRLPECVVPFRLIFLVAVVGGILARIRRQKAVVYTTLATLFASELILVSLHFYILKNFLPPLNARLAKPSLLVHPFSVVVAVRAKHFSASVTAIRFVARERTKTAVALFDFDCHRSPRFDFG